MIQWAPGLESSLESRSLSRRRSQQSMLQLGSQLEGFAVIGSGPSCPTIDPECLCVHTPASQGVQVSSLF